MLRETFNILSKLKPGCHVTQFCIELVQNCSYTSLPIRFHPEIRKISSCKHAKIIKQRGIIKQEETLSEKLVIMCQLTMIVCNPYHCEKKNHNNNNKEKYVYSK